MSSGHRTVRARAQRGISPASARSLWEPIPLWCQSRRHRRGRGHLLRQDRERADAGRVRRARGCHTHAVEAEPDAGPVGRAAASSGRSRVDGGGGFPQPRVAGRAARDPAVPVSVRRGQRLEAAKGSQELAGTMNRHLRPGTIKLSRTCLRPAVRSRARAMSPPDLVRAVRSGSRFLADQHLSAGEQTFQALQSTPASPRLPRSRSFRSPRAARGCTRPVTGQTHFRSPVRPILARVPA